MAIIRFRDFDTFRVADTAEVVPAFGFSVTDKQQLTQVLLTTYIHGTVPGNDRLQAFVYSDLALTKLVATSDFFVLSLIENLGANWYGQIGFTFPTKPWIGLGNTFYVSIGSSNYTKTALYYVSFLLRSDDIIKYTVVSLRGEPV